MPQKLSQMIGNKKAGAFAQRAWTGAKTKFKKRYGTWNDPNMARITKDLAFVKSIINAEKKFIDVVSSGTTLQSGTTGTIILLNGLAQGDTYTSRDGNSFKMVSLQIQGYFALNAGTQDMVKLSIVLDQQPNAASPAYSTIYDVTTAAAAYALRTKQQVDRFRVLKELMFTLNANGDTICSFKEYIKLDIHTKNNDSSAGTIADITTNALYLTFGGNLTANFSSIAYASRVRFIDN